MEFKNEVVMQFFNSQTDIKLIVCVCYKVDNMTKYEADNMTMNDVINQQSSHVAGVYFKIIGKI